MGDIIKRKSGQFDETDMEIARMYKAGIKQPEIARRLGISKSRLEWLIIRLINSGKIKRRFPRGTKKRLSVDDVRHYRAELEWQDAKAAKEAAEAEGGAET